MVVTVFLAALINLLQTVSKDRIQLELNSSSQLALDLIERDIRYSTTFATSLPSQFPDPYGATNSGTGGTNAWSHKGVPASTSKRALILRAQATNLNPYALERKQVFVNGSVSNPYTVDPALDCSTKLTLNPRLPYYTIYFVRDSVLYRRTLTDTSTGLCATAGNVQHQRLSCPPELRSTWNASCSAQDEVAVRDVTNFSIDYYQRDEDNPTIFTLISDAYTSTDPGVLIPARDAEVNLTLSKTSGGKVIQSTLGLRASRINEE
ncbi:MAG TPA: hypothetical protein VNI82_00125 [Candidatus Nitrosotenuis sp.]|nr:hypothetical protein [Candidatus Nitrosotenuis sp.]